VTCDLLPLVARACLPPFEQFIEQQMVQLQDFISKCLHHHTLSNMLSNKTFETHFAWILTCYSPRVNTWFTTRLIFLTFWIFSPIFCKALHTRLGPPLFKLQASFDVCAHIPSTLWVSTSYVMLMQWTHWNPWCNSQHLCRHCMKC
jgi:hypothetical protein